MGRIVMSRKIRRARFYSVSVVPFQRGNSSVPVSALLTADDLTQVEQLRRLEVEAANLRLIKSMADRLAHEIGNALVPLATHQQLLAEKYKDREFRESLDQALADGVKRVTRLINQMRFLAREGHIQPETFAVGKLIEDAYQEARKHQPADAARLQFENGGEPIIVTGDPRRAQTRACRNHAQRASGGIRKSRKLASNCTPIPMAGETCKTCKSKFRTTAPASPPKPRRRPPRRFSPRATSVWVGIDRQPEIIETHHGKLEIVPPQAGHPGVVRVSLPVDSGISTAV